VSCLTVATCADSRLAPLGELDHSEVIVLFKKVYEQSGLSRSKKRVEREVKEPLLLGTVFDARRR